MAVPFASGVAAPQFDAAGVALQTYSRPPDAAMAFIIALVFIPLMRVKGLVTPFTVWPDTA